MRSGIMAATVPISRVRIIAGATSYSRTIVRGNGRRGGSRDRHRLHQAPGGTTQERKPFTVTGTEVCHEPARGFHQLRLRRHMVETHDVAELVKDRRPLVSRLAPPGGLGPWRVLPDQPPAEL